MDPWAGRDAPLFTHGSNVVPKDRGVEEGVGIFLFEESTGTGVMASTGYKHNAQVLWME